MANPFSNKKKIRGWRRRIKQIEQWKQRFIDLDVEQLFCNHRDYVKLWIDPFFRLTRRNPPMWYSRLLLEAMIEVYQSWYQQMNRLNEPFYLKIWLYHPNFIHSQIVVAFRDCLHFYDNTFEQSNDNKDFPSQLYGKIPDLHNFKWKLSLESEYYSLAELQADVGLGFRTNKSIEAIKNKAYKCETVKGTNGEDTIYSVKLGNVWLGELS